MEKNCGWYREQISACLDGALREEERRELMEHLAVCGDCRAYFDDQMAMQEALFSLEAPAPEGFAARVMERVRAESAPEKKVLRFPLWRRWAAMAACCAVVFLGVWGSGILRPETSEQATDMLLMNRAAPAPAEQRPAESADVEAEEPAAQNGEIMVAAAPPAADSARQAEAAICAEQGWTLTASGPAAQAWVEEQLGQSWAPGALYFLTEEQYNALSEVLSEAGEEFAETAAEEPGWCLLAGDPA